MNLLKLLLMAIILAALLFLLAGAFHSAVTGR